MTRFARLAALCAGIAMSACTCAPEKPPLPEKRVDSLFAFDEDAFAFANFGGRGSGSAMNAAMLERLHGKADICDPTSTECRLTPLAKEYMRSVNDAMEGGRCEGFAVLSGLMASGDVDVTTFGGNGGRELTLEGNRALGAEIAYWFTTQYLTEVVFDSTQTLSGEDTVRFLAQVYSAGAAAPYRLGIVRIDEGGFMTGGHAILATGVGPGEADGQYFIYVYDNNLPDAEQKIVVDVNAGTWEYVASTNPDDPAALYSGTPDNGNVLFVAALSPRRGQHPCAFCSSEASLQQVFGSAGAVVAVEDDSGARTGEVDGRIVDEVAGSRTVPLVSANNTDRVGTMTVMPSQGVTMTVSQGEPGAPASVRLLAPNLVIAAENLTFGEDGSGEAVLQTNEDGSDVSFAPADGGGGASLTVGSTGEDGTQTVMSVTVPEGEAVGAIEITTGEDGNPTVAVDGDGETTIEIEVTREGPEGADSFTGSVEVPDGGAATLLVDEWAEGDGELGAEIDEDGDGQGDQTVVVEETEPLVPPAAPTGLTATAQGQERIALSWQDNATDEIAYEVERDDGAGFARIAVLAPDTVDYVDSGLTPATTYRYRVRATAAEAVSDYSDVVTATTDAIVLFTVGGSVRGLRGTLVLGNRGTGEELTVDADGPFVFSTAQNGGTTFDVAVVRAPAEQRCTVEDGLGIVLADVTDVVVTCVDTFTVGGVVRGLRSGGLVLQNNGVDPLPIDADGEFTFATRVDLGDRYAVAVRRQAPGYECVVQDGAGVISASVTDVVVLCAPTAEPTFTLAVTVTGLPSQAGAPLVLQNNGAEQLRIDADGTHPFLTPLLIDDAYEITVVEEPAGFVCTVADGAGVAPGDVTVAVSCVRVFRVGGTVAGLNTGNSLTLVLQDTTTVTATDNGAFTFPGFFPVGTPVASVAVQTAPADQRCTVAHPTGIVSDADVLDIAVTCVDTFVVGGTLTAPAGAAVTIANTAGTDTITVAGDAGTFAFARRFDVDEAYAVTASGTDLTCTVTNGTGTVQGTVDTIAVVCVDTVSISVSVTGLVAAAATGLVLQNNGGDDLPVDTDAVLPFATLLGRGDAYAVTVQQQPTGASCSVVDGAGTADGDIVVDVVCNPLFRIGGTVAGLNTGNSITLVLQDTTIVTVSDNGAFTFPGFFPAGTSVASVAVQTAPADERCTVARPTGTVSDADVLDIAVTCIDTFVVGGTLTAPAGASVTIANTAGTDTVTVAGDAGTFTFARRFDVDENYAVTAAGTGLLCSVVNGVDVVRAAVTNIAVTCVGSISVSASVTGLTAAGATGLVLQNNGSDDLSVGGDGVVAFSTLSGRGTPYAVTVAQQPAGALCSVSNGSGTADANVVVDVACQQAYRIGGTATGLNTGNALTLELVGGPSVTLTANGSFTFPGFFATGTSVALTSTLVELSDERCSVVSPPAAQVGSADVLDLAVTCVDTFVVGGTLAAPVAASVTVANTAATDSVTVPGDAGTFAFARRFAVGEDYVVEASGDDVLCTVTDGQGTVAAAVDNIAVNCVAAVDVSVTVSGLTAAGATGLVLQNNGGNNLSFNADSTSSFPSMPTGDPYAVTILVQPVGATCSVANGTGTADVDVNIAVTCEQLFRIGGTTAGLNAGNSVTLELTEGATVTVSANGSFTFPGFFPTGASVSLLSTEFELGDERCTVVAPTPQVGSADVLDLAVTCVDTFVVGGTLTAPATASVTLSTTNENGTDTVTVPGDAGTFAFTRRFALDEQYAVLASGTDLQCTVTKGAGSVAGAVDDIAVNCSELVDVVVTVTGLTAAAAVGLELQNNGGDPLVIDEDGTYSFPPLTLGSGYDIEVLTQPVGALCAVSQPTGDATSDVNVAVTCERLFQIGGTVSGLAENLQFQLELLIGQAAPATISQNGEFRFPGFFEDLTLIELASETIEVIDPLDPQRGQRCTVAVPTDQIAAADVLDIGVICVDTFTVGGTITAPVFSAVTITNQGPAGGTANAAPGATTFTFSQRFAVSEQYVIAATATAATCSVANGAGSVTAAVDNIAVSCTLAPMNLQLANDIAPDLLPAGIGLAGVEFDVRLAEPFANFYGTPVRAEVRDANGALAAIGTWALRGQSTQDARITFSDDVPVAARAVVALGTPRVEDVRGNPTGGTLFEDDCPGDQVPIGIDAELGASVDGLRVVCGTIQFDPNTLAITIGAGTTLPLRGGTNEAQASARCPTDTALVAFSGESGSLIDRVDLQCATLTVTGTAPDLTVIVGTPVSGGGVGGTGGTAFASTSCAAGEIASGLSVRAGSQLNALGLRCSAIGLSPTLAVGNHDVRLLSNFSVDGEQAEDRVFAQTGGDQPLRVQLPGLTGLSPAVLQQGDSSAVLGAGVPLFGDSIFVFRRGGSLEPASLAFRGILTPGFCASRSQAGCLVQQAPFQVSGLPAGIYDVCVVPGIDPGDQNTWPLACPVATPTTLGPVELTIAGCGDGNIAENEGCDDGNLVSSDGCSAACVVEEACVAENVVSVAANDLALDAPLPATFTFTSSDFFPASIQTTCGGGAAGKEVALTFTAPADAVLVARTLDANNETDVDTVLALRTDCESAAGEVCDDDGTSELDPSGTYDSIFEATVQSGVTYFVIVDSYSEDEPAGVQTVTVELLLRTPVCGDGFLAANETCDDRNSSPGDGCSDLCVVEPGFSCPPGPGACSSICGDGLFVGTEGCDDSNLTSGDGCSNVCVVENGFSCPPGAGACSATCGDGLVVGNEACDDGDVTSGDGCSDLCTVESTYSCTGQPSVCQQLFGDGRDGPLTVTTASSLDAVTSNGRTCADAFSANVLAVNAPTGVTLATAPAAGCLAAGDVVLLVNLQGRASIVTNVGNHERLTVATVDSATVTFNESIQQFYGNAADSNAGIGTQTAEQRVILQRVPQYTTVTVTDELTTAAWNGSIGGVLAFEAGDGVIVENGGAIHADGKGYRGASSPTLTLASGRPGEGPGGYAVPYLAAANTVVLTGTNLSAGNGAGITVDREGNLYVVENAAGRRVRKVTATGTITTIVEDDDNATNGVELFGGADVEVDEQGFLYVADGNGLLGSGGDRVLRVNLTVNPPTVSTLVSNVVNPMGLAVLGDTLFVATFGDSTTQTAGQLLMYDASDGQFLATVSSNLGVLATDVEIGPDGNFYIAGLATNAASNGLNNIVKRVSLVTGSVDDFVDIGLSDPVSLAFDGIGDLWVNFAFSNRLARIRDGNRSDRFLSGDFDGSGAIDNGEATDAGNGLAIDVDGALYTYLNSNVVRKITGPISVEGGGPVALAAPEASGGTGGGGNQCAPEYGFGVAGGGGGHADSGADPLHVAKSELSVQNAGFEQPTVAAGEAGAAGDISGWSTVVNSQQTTVGVYRPAAGENIVPADGSQVAYLNAGNPGARLQQTLSTTLGFGTRVVVSGRLILRPNHAPAPVSVFVNGVEHVLPAPMAGAGRPFSVTVDVLRGSPLNGQQLSVEFIAGNSGVQTLLDGVTIAVSDRCGGRGGPAYGTMNHLAFGAGGGSGGNDDALHDNPAGGAGGAGGGIVSIRAPSIEIQTGGSISARGAAGIGDAPGCDGSGTSADPNPCYDFSGPGGGGAGGTVRLDTNQLLGAPSVDGGTGGHGTPGAAGVGGAGAPGFLVDRGSPGVLAEFFSGSIQTLDSFGSLTPMAAPAPAVRTSTPFALIGGDNFGARFTALIDIPTSGLWTFATTSDDGSRLFIDDALVVDNDGLHGPDLRTGSVNLSAGLHSFEVQFFELGGGEFLQVSWQEPGQSTLVDIPVSAFSQPLGASVPPT